MDKITAIVTIICSFFGSGGIVVWLLNRFTDKRLKRMDQIIEGIHLGLENDAVIFKALREHQINGESEMQEAKMNEYFRKSFIKQEN